MRSFAVALIGTVSAVQWNYDYEATELVEETLFRDIEIEYDEIEYSI